MTEHETEVGSSLVINVTKAESAHGTNSVSFIDDDDNEQSFSTLADLVEWINDYIYTRE